MSVVDVSWLARAVMTTSGQRPALSFGPRALMRSIVLDGEDSV
jgi:hypothetical protein